MRSLLRLIFSVVVFAHLQIPLFLGAEVTRRIRSIKIEAGGIFEEDESGSIKKIDAFANSLHVKTRAKTIRNELWFQEGDEISDRELEHLNFSIRGMNLFSDVSVDPPSLKDEGEVDLLIKTADRVSLLFEPLGSFVGGTGSYGWKIGEANFMGLGDRVEVKYNHLDDKGDQVSTRYTNRHFINPRIRLDVRARQDDEGYRYAVSVSRRRLDFLEPWAWSASVVQEEDAVDYYRDGESAFEIPRLSKRGGFGIEKSLGNGKRIYSFGSNVSYSGSEYRDRDIFETEFGRELVDSKEYAQSAHFRINYRYGTIETYRLDALDYEETYELGWSPEISIGNAWYSENGKDFGSEPVLAGRVSGAFELDEDFLVSFAANFSLRDRLTDSVDFNLASFFHMYYLLNERNTIVGSVAYDEVSNGSGVPVELTLGENNGLRGYNSRRFTGSRRLRFNLEDRIWTGIKLDTIHLGMACFFDLAAISDSSIGNVDWYSSVGVGFRIGSKKWLGREVLRLDFAVPLSELGRLENDYTVSIALGQVVEFWGNDSVLSEN